MANESIKEKNLEVALKATFDLFLSIGIEASTKEMLIQKCTLSRATINRYFPNKSD